MGWESSDMLIIDLGLFLQLQMRKAKLKSAYNLFIIGPTGVHYKANCRLWCGNLLMSADLTLSPSSRSDKGNQT